MHISNHQEIKKGDLIETRDASKISNAEVISITKNENVFSNTYSYGYLLECNSTSSAGKFQTWFDEKELSDFFKVG